jgi:hypothetical protein
MMVEQKHRATLDCQLVPCMLMIAISAILLHTQQQ